MEKKIISSEELLRRIKIVAPIFIFLGIILMNISFETGLAIIFGSLITFIYSFFLYKNLKKDELLNEGYSKKTLKLQYYLFLILGAISIISSLFLLNYESNNNIENISMLISGILFFLYGLYLKFSK